MTRARFTHRQINAFIAVADVSSFSKAGEHLNLTASAVSQLISDLENTLGFRLFDRTTRVVSLSQAGRQFHPPAKAILKQFELAHIAAEDIRNRATGMVRIAAPLVLASAALPPIVKAYHALRPGVVVRIRDSGVDTLIEKVLTGEVDLAIGSDEIVRDDIRRDTLFSSAWVAWCAPDDSIAPQGMLSWTTLGSLPLILAGYDHQRSLALSHAGVEDGSTSDSGLVDVVGNLSTAFGMVAAGMGVTVAPAYTGSLARTFGLVMCPIAEPQVMQHVYSFHSLTRAATPAAQEFGDYVNAWFGGRDDPGAWGVP